MEVLFYDPYILAKRPLNPLAEKPDFVRTYVRRDSIEISGGMVDLHHRSGEDAISDGQIIY